MGSRHFRPLQCILLALTLCSPVHSDVILSADTADAVLKELHLLAAQIHDSNNLPARISAIFARGIEATALAGLLSREVAAHGEQDILLVDTTVRRAAELGVVIHWSGEHRRYYYDGPAFQRYLELAPRGSRAGFFKQLSVI